MGKTFRAIVGKKDMRILIVGLDGAGKTTILYQLKVGEVVNTVPTIGFNVENVSYKNINFDVWDVGGQDQMRPMWRHYYKNARGLVFVVDSNNPERLQEAREELDQMLNEEELQDVPLLVFANKKDLPNALPTSELSERLGLEELRKRRLAVSGSTVMAGHERRWLIQSACATNGDGILQGLDWLSHVLAGTSRDRKE